MQMTPVDSSAVEAIGHDGGEKLHVRYEGGRTYVHAGVSPALHERLMADPSKGRFIAQHIRNQHPAKAAK